MQPDVYLFQTFCSYLLKAVLRYVYVKKKKKNLYPSSIFITITHLSPDKLAGAFINRPKRFVQKRTKQKSYSTCKYI